MFFRYSQFIEENKGFFAVCYTLNKLCTNSQEVHLEEVIDRIIQLYDNLFYVVCAQHCVAVFFLSGEGEVGKGFG